MAFLAFIAYVEDEFILTVAGDVSNAYRLTAT